MWSTNVEEAGDMLTAEVVVAITAVSSWRGYGREVGSYAPEARGEELV